jgi:hypothetical protein
VLVGVREVGAPGNEGRGCEASGRRLEGGISGASMGFSGLGGDVGGKKEGGAICGTTARL